MYFIWWRRWKRFLEICYLWWNKFVLLVCLCSHSKWWLSLWCAVLLPFSVFERLLILYTVAEAASIVISVVVVVVRFLCAHFAFSPALFCTVASFRCVHSFARSFDSVFGSQNINKTFSTVARLNGSAFIFIFVYRFGSLAKTATDDAATQTPQFQLEQDFNNNNKNQ